MVKIILFILAFWMLLLVKGDVFQIGVLMGCQNQFVSLGGPNDYVANNCSQEYWKTIYVGSNPISICSYPNCTGTWQFIIGFGAITGPVPIYCCVCTTTNCDRVTYNDPVNCPTGQMRTSNFGKNYYCSDNTCPGTMYQMATDMWTCVSPNCTGQMQRGYPLGTTCNGPKEQWP